VVVTVRKLDNRRIVDSCTGTEKRLLNSKRQEEEWNPFIEGFDVRYEGSSSWGQKGRSVKLTSGEVKNECSHIFTLQYALILHTYTHTHIVTTLHLIGPQIFERSVSEQDWHTEM
jgi:hypothetical protein